VKAALGNLAKQNPLALAAGAVLVAGFLYYLARRTLKDAAGLAGGIVSGNNALTEGTDYAGSGIAGTLGAGANAALGGVPAALGEWIAGVFAPRPENEWNFYTVTFPDGSKHAISAAKVSAGGRFTYGGRDYILGSVGTVRVARYAQ
jgi:hypothetical protein